MRAGRKRRKLREVPREGDRVLIRKGAMVKTWGGLPKRGKPTREEEEVEALRTTLFSPVGRPNIISIEGRLSSQPGWILFRRGKNRQGSYVRLRDVSIVQGPLEQLARAHGGSWRS